MSIDQILKNINSLYPKDRTIAKYYLHNRKLYDLKDLVDSSIVILEKDLAKENPREESLQLNKSRIIDLKEAVDGYLMKIDPDYFYGDSSSYSFEDYYD